MGSPMSSAVRYFQSSRLVTMKAATSLVLLSNDVKTPVKTTKAGKPWERKDASFDLHAFHVPDMVLHTACASHRSGHEGGL